MLDAVRRLSGGAEMEFLTYQGGALASARPECPGVVLAVLGSRPIA